MDAPGFMDGGSEITKAFILAMIKTRSVTPTVDAIPVVRCKDCKYYEKTGAGTQFARCNHHQIMTMLPGDWYCADGELKRASDAATSEAGKENQT